MEVKKISEERNKNAFRGIEWHAGSQPRLTRGFADLDDVTMAIHHVVGGGTVVLEGQGKTFVVCFMDNGSRVKLSLCFRGQGRWRKQMDFWEACSHQLVLGEKKKIQFLRLSTIWKCGRKHCSQNYFRKKQQRSMDDFFFVFLKLSVVMHTDSPYYFVAEATVSLTRPHVPRVSWENFSVQSRCLYL